MTINQGQQLERQPIIRRGYWLVAALIAAYIVAFIIFTLGRYARYNATGWDLGIFTQLTWNASRGLFLQNTLAENNNMLAIHAPYITILLAPLFWLWADPRTLLIAQTVMLGVGAWPIARLAGRHFKAWWIPPLFATLWLFYPALGWINRWDFHEIAPAAMFFAFAFEACDRRSWRQVDIWLILAVLCKEEVGLNAAFFGIYMVLIYQRPRRAGVIWFVIGITWFTIHAFVIFPLVRHAPNGLPIHAARYFWFLNGDPTEIAARLLGPDTLLKIGFIFKIFAPVAFIAWLAPRRLIAAIPTFALSLLSSYEPQFDIFMHYTAVIIPCVIVAAIFGAGKLYNWLTETATTDQPEAKTGSYLPTRGIQDGIRKCITNLLCLTERFWRPYPLMAVSFTLLLAVFLCWLTYNPFTLTPNIPIYGWDAGANLNALYEVETIIPPNACVVASNEIEPHYSVRPETYVLGARGDMDGCAYMIVDLNDTRHNDFTDNEQVACFQFWSQKRTPIYYKDSVVVLQQMPASGTLSAKQQMRAFCDSYSKSKTAKS